MSTRANGVVYKDQNTPVVEFYCHCDGYIEDGLGDDLKEMCNAADWDFKKIIKGVTDYEPVYINEKELPDGVKIKDFFEDPWEDRVVLQGDIDYFYVINVEEKSIMAYEVNLRGFTPIEEAGQYVKETTKLC